MIQVNLVPDIKAEYLRAQSQKQTVVTIAFLASAGFIALVVMMFLYVSVIQAQHTNGLQKDIDALNTQIQSFEEADKVVTVENQNQALEPIHLQKPLVSRLSGYLTKLTPNTIQFNGIEIEFETNTMKISGTGEEIKAVNTFVDTLKLATYSIEETDTGNSAFSSVVLNSVGSSDEDSSTASFEILAVFDPLLFDAHQNVVLVVPKVTSTRSEAQKPRSLFEPVEDSQ